MTWLVTSDISGAAVIAVVNQMNSHGSIVATLFGIAIIWMVLLDAFETVVLPRRVLRHFKLTAYFYRRTWIPWRGIARQDKDNLRGSRISWDISDRSR